MIQNQVYVFLWSIVTGAFLAFMFDLFRASRKVGKFNVIKVALQDILYCILAAFVIIMTSFVTNDGEIRGYMFIGYFLGVMFYLLLFFFFIHNMPHTIKYYPITTAVPEAVTIIILPP